LVTYNVFQKKCGGSFYVKKNLALTRCEKNKIINNMTQQLPTRIAMLKFAEQLPICHV